MENLDIPMNRNEFMKIKQNKIPKSAQKVKPDQRGYVLAEGEVTGHYHAIEACDDVELYKLGEELIVANTATVQLKHQEHNQVTLNPKVWNTGIVVEYDYLSKMERKVVD